MDSKCDCGGCRTVRGLLAAVLHDARSGLLEDEEALVRQQLRVLDVVAREWWRGWWWGFTVGTVPMAAEWLFHAVHS